LAARWHRLRAAYRICNLATHHVLGFTVKLALLLYFAFTILFLTLRYAVLPNIDHYKGDIERRPAARSAIPSPFPVFTPRGTASAPICSSATWCCTTSAAARR
jgi:hypothetical protein